MTPEDLHRVKSAHASALPLSPTDRERLLGELFPEDTELRSEVEDLLRWHDDAGGFLSAPFSTRLIERVPAEPKIGRVGPWEIIRELGRGGSATVYLARRADDLFEKQVAIKILNRLWDTGEAIRRFQREIQILARLEHPYVVRLFEAGTTADGFAYIVTELIDGIRIDTFASNLSLRDKLKLFQKVCDGVSAAHRNLVVHRDIKPSNVLVTKDGAPKLLDFGIALLLDENIAVTETGLERMTPQYASPEQVRRERGVTTASDVYSLGVLLYELISGRPPYAGPAHEIPSQILHEDPLPLPEAPRDLAAIVSMALSKKPGDRYESVVHLREDVGCFLGNSAVQAKRAGTFYLIRLFLRRYRLAFGIGTAFVFLILGSVASVLYEAEQARNHADVIKQLAFKDLDEAAQTMWRSPQTTAISAELRRKRIEIIGKLLREDADDASIKRELLWAHLYFGMNLGAVNSKNLGRVHEAGQQFRAAMSLAEELYHEHGHRAQAVEDLTVLLGYVAENEAEIGNRDSARKLRLRALDVIQQHVRSGGEQTHETPIVHAVAMSEVAKIFASEGKPESLELHDRAVKLRQGLVEALPPGGDDRRLLRGLSIALADTAESCVALGRYSHAESVINRSLGIEEMLFLRDPKHVETRWMYAERLRLKGQILLAAGRSKEAIRVIQDSLALYRDNFSGDPEDYRNLRSLVAGLEVLTNALERAGRVRLARSIASELGPLAAQEVRWCPISVRARQDFERAATIQRCLEATSRGGRHNQLCSTQSPATIEIR